MLCWKGGQSPNAVLLKVGYLLCVHPQLSCTSLVEMVTQHPNTLLKRSTAGWGGCAFPFNSCRLYLGMI